MADNTVTLVGNITRDPELRFTAVRPGDRHLRPRRQPPLAEPQTQRVGGADLLLRRRRAGAQMGENVAESLPKGARVIVTGRLEQRSWETQDGDKRSKVEVIADEIGPSLRWATCEVTKNERREPGEGGAGGRWRTPAPRRPAAALRQTRSRSDGQEGTPHEEQGQRSAVARRRSASSSRRGSTTSTTRTSTCCAGSCPTGPRSAPGESPATTRSSSARWRGPSRTPARWRCCPTRTASRRSARRVTVAPGRPGRADGPPPRPAGPPPRPAATARPTRSPELDDRGVARRRARRRRGRGR